MAVICMEQQLVRWILVNVYVKQDTLEHFVINVILDMREMMMRSAVSMVQYSGRPIYRYVSADISVLPIQQMLIGYWYWPIRRSISVAGLPI